MHREALAAELVEEALAGTVFAVPVEEEGEAAEAAIVPVAVALPVVAAGMEDFRVNCESVYA